MQKFKSVEQIINQLKPEKPIYCIRKNSIRSAVKYFNKNFPGKILYAVKTNPHPAVIQTIIDSGVEQFDVASIEEIKSIRSFSQTAKCSYMVISSDNSIAIICFTLLIYGLNRRKFLKFFSNKKLFFY